MTVSVRCPQCNKLYTVGGEFLGKKVKCKCGGFFHVPAATDTPVSPLDPPGAAAPPPVAPALPRPARFAVRQAPVPSAPVTAPPAPVTCPAAPIAPSIAAPVAEEEEFVEVLPDEGEETSPLLSMNESTLAAPALRTPATLQPAGLAIKAPRAAGVSWRRHLPPWWVFLLGFLALIPLSVGGLFLFTWMWPAWYINIPAEPYALNDPVQRVRTPDGQVSAEFPERATLLPYAGGLLAGKVKLNAIGGIGHNDQLYIYMPAGTHAPRSLPCVLVAPAGGTLTTAPAPDSARNQAEYLPYAKEGFAVVGFDQDGETVPNQSMGTTNYQFFAAQAGLVNARNALEYVIARLPEVDPNRIYVAGHSSGGTLSLLFAEHESRLRGCVAYAPIANGAAFYKKQAIEYKLVLFDKQLQLLAETSPSSHVSKMTCPVLLVHAEGDATVPVSESQSLAQELQSQGKKVQLVTTAGNDHYQTMIQQGIPTGIDWLLELDQPGSLAKRKKLREEAAEAERVAAAKQTAEKAAHTAGQTQERRMLEWVTAADNLSKELAKLDAKSTQADVGGLFHVRVRCENATSYLEMAAALANPALFVANAKHVSPETRSKLVEANQRLVKERQRVQALDAKDLKQTGVVTQIDAMILPAWFLEGRAPTTEEIAAKKKADAAVETARHAPAKRDFRQDADYAFTWKTPADAVKLLEADALVGSDKDLLENMKWSPALKRPFLLMHLAFGIELNGFPGSGPANLQAPKGGAAGKRNTHDDWRLQNEFKTLLGPIGNWLAEGLQNRFDSGAFGDWGQKHGRGVFEHRGITLLNFAPVDGQIAAAKAAGADVLMACSLTAGRDNPKNITMLVKVIDVATGEQLWESEPIRNSRLVTAQRQGKDLAGEFAGTVLTYIDDEVTLREAPKISKAELKKNLDRIASASADAALAALLELRYYELAEQVPQATIEKALVKILGEEDAKRLVSQEDRDRRKAIEKLVPASR